MSKSQWLGGVLLGVCVCIGAALMDARPGYLLGLYVCWLILMLYGHLKGYSN
jgi:hypothetical protein